MNKSKDKMYTILFIMVLCIIVTVSIVGILLKDKSEDFTKYTDTIEDNNSNVTIIDKPKDYFNAEHSDTPRARIKLSEEAQKDMDNIDPSEPNIIVED